MHSELDKKKLKNCLYIVATPIGNLNDITLRAIEILKASDWILCEDTRVSKILLNHFKIKSNLIAYHKFNEKKNVETIRSMIASGKVVSLISDAGTPLISDPGKVIVNELIKSEIDIIPIPGVSSVSAAVSVSGFSNNYYFSGFLPGKKSEMERELEELSKQNCSIVFFISPKKINKIIPIIKKLFLNRQILICREMTKVYETFYRKDVNKLDQLEIKNKGEITVVISEKKIEKKTSSLLNESDKIKIKKLINKLTVKEIVNIFSSDNKVQKSKIYDYCLYLKNEK